MAYRPKWEEKYIPDMMTWSNFGTMDFTGNPVIRIGSTLYMFGGWSISGNAYSSKIYSTAWDNPSGWADTGATCDPSVGVPTAVIGNTIYKYGPTIWSAPVSSPLTWSSTGITLANQRDNTAFVVTPNHINMYAGYNGASTNNVNYASVSTPTSFSVTTGPTGWERRGCYLDGDEVYIVGGFNAQSNMSIYRASSPGGTPSLDEYNVGYTLENNPFIFHVGNMMWTGGNSQNLYYARTSTPSKWFVVPGVLSTSMRYTIQWIGPDGYAYVVRDNTGAVIRSGRKRIFVTDPPVEGGTYAHRRAVTETGEATLYTVHCQMGMCPWYTNRRDRF